MLLEYGNKPCLQVTSQILIEQHRTSSSNRTITEIHNQIWSSEVHSTAECHGPGLLHAGAAGVPGRQTPVPKMTRSIQSYRHQIISSDGNLGVAISQDAMDRGYFKQKEPSGFQGDQTLVPKMTSAPDMASICWTAYEIACGMAHLHTRNVAHGGASCSGNRTQTGELWLYRQYFTWCSLIG